MKLDGVTAVLIRAKNVGLVADWYAIVLGFDMQVERDGARYGEVQTSAGRVQLAITPRPDNMPSGAPTVALTWRVADFDAAIAHLEALEIPVRARMADETGRFAFLRDPEGNEVALQGAPDV